MSSDSDSEEPVSNSQSLEVACPSSKSPSNEDFEQLKLLNKYLIEDLANVRKKLKKKKAQVDKLTALLEQSEKRKIEEVDMEEKEMTCLNEQIKELVIRDEETEKNKELTKEVDYWKQELNREKEKNAVLKKKYEELEEEKLRREAEKDRLIGRILDEEETTCPLPVCQVCKCRFDNTERRTPRMLKCGHTICEECAGKLAQNVLIGTDQQELGLEIKCPYDQNTTHVLERRVNNLPKNFTVMECVNGDW